MNGMKAVGIRELKNRLSEYIRQVRSGEEILVTDRGEVVAELRPPHAPHPEGEYPELLRMAREGRVTLGGPNSPDLYPEMAQRMTLDEIFEILDESRGER